MNAIHRHSGHAITRPTGITDLSVADLIDLSVAHSVPTPAAAHTPIVGAGGLALAASHIRPSDATTEPALANASWKKAISGDWGTAASWSTGAVPGASNAVTLALSAAYTVTVSSYESDGSLLINNAAATLSVESFLSNASTVTVEAGTSALAAGGI